MTIFPFIQPIILENERVLLRPLEADDYEHLLPFALQEPDIWRFSLVNPAGADGMRAYIDTAIAEREAHKEYPFIIYDKQAQAYAGSSRFYDIQPVNAASQLGYTWYGTAFQRTGLNRHCKWLMLQFAFEQWGLERVEFRADANNERSIKAMQAIGCVPEGILRSHLHTFTGRRRSSIVLSILKDEWFGGVKENLLQKIQ
jgi:RimJ/RimL family protein N-acetyltransferase